MLFLSKKKKKSNFPKSLSVTGSIKYRGKNGFLFQDAFGSFPRAQDPHVPPEHQMFAPGSATPDKPTQGALGLLLLR